MNGKTLDVGGEQPQHAPAPRASLSSEGASDFMPNAKVFNCADGSHIFVEPQGKYWKVTCDVSGCSRHQGTYETISEAEDRARMLATSVNSRLVAAKGGAL